MFAERLKELRESRGLTTKELAAVCGVGVRNYQKYESGDTSPTLAGFVTLADFFEVSTDYLLGRDKFIEQNSK
jgi:transcriptional regulator with XRE-family HTH domain